MHEPRRRLRTFLSLAFVAVVTSCDSSAQATPAVNAPPPPAVVSNAFLAISDVHLDNRTGWSQYGADTGTGLWHTAQKELGALISTTKPTFVIYVGDLPRHSTGSHSVTPTERAGDVKDVLQGLRTTVGSAGPPLFYVPGNNDSIEGDYGPFTSDSTDPKTGDPWGTPFEQDPGQGWPLINGDASCSGSTRACLLSGGSSKHGYYSAYPLGSQGGLRLIVMNTVMFTSGYFGSDQSTVAADQLTWVGQQLADAADATPPEAVLLAMHVPPGLDAHSHGTQGPDDDLKTTWSSSLDVKGKWGSSTASTESILDAFLATVYPHTQKTIRGVITAHTHMDGFYTWLDGNGVLKEVAVSIPAVTPGHDNNPAIKLITYDVTNFEFLDYRTYFAPNPQSSFGKIPYSFRHDSNRHEATLFDCVSAMSTAERAAVVRSQYLVHTQYVFKHHPPDWNKISEAIVVEPGL